jgi:hypothetical protein
MAAVSIAGAAFVVEVGSPAVQYEDQVISGTVTVTPTITRTRTLGSEAFDLTDLIHAVSIEFLYDGSSGLYGALQTSAVAGTAVRLEITHSATAWLGTSMYVESLENNIEATGVATATVTFTGQLAYA